MPRIEHVAEDYTLPEGSLCLGKNGWTKVAEQLAIDTRGVQLVEALDFIWDNQRGLLGYGEMVFCQVANFPHPRGFVVFHPEPTDGE
jgi:hypothetical protein